MPAAVASGHTNLRQTVVKTFDQDTKENLDNEYNAWAAARTTEQLVAVQFQVYVGAATRYVLHVLYSL